MPLPLAIPDGFILEPGDSIGMHGHMDHTIYVLEGGTVTVYWEGTEPEVLQLEKGMGFMKGPVTDVAKNTGETTVRLLITEIYRPRMTE